MRKFNVLNGTNIIGFKKNAKEYLLTQPWRGNVRELENTIERAMVLSTGEELDVSAFMIFDEAPLQDVLVDEDKKNTFIFKFGEEVEPLKEVEKKYIQFVFERNQRAKEVTAKALGIDRKTLYRRLQEIDPSL